MSNPDPTLSTDEQRLAALGYKQELHRGWSGFSNFAISLTIICILSGCFTTYGQAWNDGGPIAISIGWPVISILVLLVGLSMAELASKYPTAGGIYYWAYSLGGVRWAWFTGWFNLLGLVAITAAVDYGAASFLNSVLALYNLHFILNFATASSSSILHHTFVLFFLILAAHSVINIFSSHLVALLNRISAWWMLGGVTVIVGVLIFGPTSHQRFSWVFGHRSNFTGFSSHIYWFFVLPLGFLLTMYTFTGYDASAHLSEETHDAERAAPRGLWKSIAYSAVGGWVLLLAITFAATHVAAITKGGGGAVPVIETALSTGLAKLVLDISTVGQLFCGMGCVAAASRMVFAFSRDGAVPGHSLWRRLNKQRTPTWSVLLVVVLALIITIPALFGNSAGLPVAFFAVTSITTIGLYIAYILPVFLRWRMGDAFQPGVWALGKHYRWINLIAIIWVVLCVIIFCLPGSPGAVPWDSGFSWSDFNYAPVVTIALALGVWIGWEAGAKRSFKGPVRTLDDPDVGTSDDPALMPAN
ncbi:MAG: amino acid permease [Acidimicrobiales bacterium]|jgi:amino acid transporter